MQQVLRAVGQYEILQELAEGGMARVYLARQPRLDRLIALKELSVFGQHGPEMAERFVRESRVAGALNHPNIVSVFDFFQHDGTAYIAMEYVERGSLRPLVNALTLAQAGGVLEDVLSGLGHAHQHGIVHRDVKPENVLVTTGGRVKLADFGIAKALNSVQTAQYATSSSTALGTPAYMSPEQALGEQVTIRSDLYALGVMAYEMLTHRLPFGEPTRTPFAILLGHVNADFVPPGVANPNLDPGIAAWIERMMARSPDDRPERPDIAWKEFEELIVSVLGPMWRRDAPLPDVSAGNGHAVTGLTTGGGYRTVTPHHLTRLPEVNTHNVTIYGGQQAITGNGFLGATAGEPIMTPPLDPQQPPVATVAPPPVTPAPESLRAPAPERRRHAGRRVLIAAAALVPVIAAGGFFLTQDHTPLLDTAPVSAEIRDVVDDQQPVKSVTCPPRVERRAGVVFACTVALEPGSQSYQAIVKQGPGGKTTFDLRVG